MEEGKMKVDIYDFDKTAIPYDSALHYWFWSMAHCPWTLVLLPFQLFWGFLMVTKILPVPVFKKIAFNFVRLINTEKTVKKYWDKHQNDIYDFFKPENRDPDRKVVLISASPDFLIEEIAKRMKIDYCIASPHSKKNGHLLGKVCRKEEKVRRLNEIITLQNQLSLESNKRDIGKTFEILVEGYSKRSHEDMYGRTSQYKTVIIPRKGRHIGELVNVRILSCTAATLIGEVVE